MTTVIHKADSRGYTEKDWYNAYHSFSFKKYHDPERENFGALKVLNDNILMGGKGFGAHSHSNIEIISILLEGELEHKDNLGNIQVIRENDIQIISAGTGIFHYEFNYNRENPVKFLQIWIEPNKKDIKPRYQKITLQPFLKNNCIQQILSPFPENDGVWICQNTWAYVLKMDDNIVKEYQTKRSNNGIYIFVIDGECLAENIELQRRDGLGIQGIENIKIKAKPSVKLLLLDVPLPSK